MEKIKPSNSTIICLIIGTAIAGILAYAVWKPIQATLQLDDWAFFVAYAIIVPTLGFYKAIYWGFWMAKLEDKYKEQPRA